MLKISRTRAAIVLLLALAVIASATLYSSDQYYHRYNRYDSGKDYVYGFGETSCRIIPADVSRSAITVRRMPGRWDTGFVEIKVRANLFGKIVEPYVDLTVGDVSIRQYVERGADGIRYFNISRFADAKGGDGLVVGIVGNHLTWDRQSARVILFENEFLGREKVLVVSPHPDDAEIAAFGYYSDRDASIVTITAGDGGEDTYKGLERSREEDYRLKSRLRIWDSISIPMLGGVPPSRSANLGYFSNTLKAMHDDPGGVVTSRSTNLSLVGTLRTYNLPGLAPAPLRKPTWGSIVADLVDIVKKTRPSVIVTPHPLLDSHSDHRYSTVAVLEAVRRAGLKKGFFMFYVNHYVMSQIYPFGENDGVVSLPPRFDNAYIFRSLYSHPLSPEEKTMKFFALEAMHDLRPSLLPVRYDVRWFVESITRTIYYSGRYILGLDTSFFRRSARPNELFFVVPFDNVVSIERQLGKVK